MLEFEAFEKQIATPACSFLRFRWMWTRLRGGLDPSFRRCHRQHGLLRQRDIERLHGWTGSRKPSCRTFHRSPAGPAGANLCLIGSMYRLLQSRAALVVERRESVIRRAV